MEAYIISAYKLYKFHIQWSYLPPHNILNVADQKSPVELLGTTICRYFVSGSFFSCILFAVD